MISVRNFILSTVVVTFLVGCSGAEVKPLYVWEDYSKTVTAYNVNPSDQEAFEKHINELKKVIEKSDLQKQKVAPGIYSEYATMLYVSDKKEDAKRYFLLEKQTYPESKIFIERVTKKLYGESL